ncbi:hypothetical protein D3C80_608670 [compost metagenome]
MVGVGGEELVDEVTFRTHDFDTVVLGALCQQRAIDEILDLLFDALFVQLTRLERVDRCLDGAWRHRLGAVGITTGMEDLHADFATGFVHGLGNDAVLISFFRRAQLGRTGIHPTLDIRANTAGDHQAYAATGTLSKIGGHALEATGLLFQASVHRSHQGTVAQGGEAQIQRGEQVRVVSGGHNELHNRRNHGMRAPRTAGGARRLSVDDIKEPARAAQ